MARYLRQTNGDIYVWSELLAARDDMQEIDDPFAPAIALGQPPTVAPSRPAHDAFRTDLGSKKPTR